MAIFPKPGRPLARPPGTRGDPARPAPRPRHRQPPRPRRPRAPETPRELRPGLRGSRLAPWGGLTAPPHSPGLLCRGEWPSCTPKLPGLGRAAPQTGVSPRGPRPPRLFAPDAPASAPLPGARLGGRYSAGGGRGGPRGTPFMVPGVLGPGSPNLVLITWEGSPATPPPPSAATTT
jgi:hypothetical protein